MKKSVHILFIIFSLITILSYGQVAIVGKPLPAWQKGFLDLHHINTGRGNAAFYILPDGTTILVDAGELSPLDKRTFTPRNAMIRPDYSKFPYEWIVHYIKNVSGSDAHIDYALLTHFHDDHFGAWYPGAPLSSSGNFLLTGITGVGDSLPIGLLIDRGYPFYNYPYNIKYNAAKYAGGEIEFGKTMDNYFRFITDQQQHGMKMASLKAGSRSQLRLVHEEKKYPSFYIQNIKSNQWIWTGKDSTVFNQFPSYDSTKKETWPDENSLSLALVIHYGAFSYYTGGDNPGTVFFNDNPLRNVETPIAKAIGEVDIATMDHHGNRDAVNEFFVKTLKPHIWIGQSWSADHPGHEVLLRMASTYLYDGPRDFFSTNMLEANKTVIGPLIDRVYKSQQGHIIVRVLPGGNEYYVIILDDSHADMLVKDIFGPYYSKQKNNY